MLAQLILGAMATTMAIGITVSSMNDAGSSAKSIIEEGKNTLMKLQQSTNNNNINNINSTDNTNNTNIKRQ